MKSYSVKSNAKRFARGIAKQFGNLFVPVEPVPAPGSLGSPKMWFPAVEFIGRDFAAIPEEVRATCVVTNEPANSAPKVIGYARTGPVSEDDTASVEAIAAAAFGAGLADSGATIVAGPAAMGAPAPVIITAENSTLILTASGRRMLRQAGETVVGVPASLAAMAASLPPRVTSTPEEIAARRAERQARIGQEKAEGVRTSTGAKVKKISKKKTILDLINRPNGATQAELEAATGWQRHTLRGYIAGTLRKILAPVGVIECRKGNTDDGAKETRYVFVKHEVK